MSVYIDDISGSLVFWFTTLSHNLIAYIYVSMCLWKLFWIGKCAHLLFCHDTVQLIIGLALRQIQKIIFLKTKNFGKSWNFTNFLQQMFLITIKKHIICATAWLQSQSPRLTLYYCSFIVITIFMIIVFVWVCMCCRPNNCVPKENVGVPRKFVCTSLQFLGESWSKNEKM